MNTTIVQLVLVVTATYSGAVGFGEIFDCEVRSVLVGRLEEPQIRLSILPRDKDKLGFMSMHLHPALIEIGFTVYQKDEPYGLAPITGFVDKAKTSWEVSFIREAHESRKDK